MISHRSTYSRREADLLIKEGKVAVNGKVVVDLATQVTEADEITVSGHPLKPADAPFTVIVYNKPKGELVTKKDPRGRKTVYETLPAMFKHYIPVGRLDFASEGVLLLTDSPKVATALMTGGLERVYNIKIEGQVTPAMTQAMSEGLQLDDATKGAHPESEITEMSFAPFYAFQVIKNEGKYAKLRVAITEGKNRELRRFFGHFDTKVVDLKRISFGGISLNNLPDGQWRYLEKKEYQNLRQYLKEESKNEKNRYPDKAQNRSGQSHPRGQRGGH